MNRIRKDYRWIGFAFTITIIFALVGKKGSSNGWVYEDLPSAHFPKHKAQLYTVDQADHL